MGQKIKGYILISMVIKNVYQPLKEIILDHCLHFARTAFLKS